MVDYMGDRMIRFSLRPKYELTPEEVELVNRVGAARNTRGDRRGWKHKPALLENPPPGTWTAKDNHVIGAGGALSAGRLLGVPWNSDIRKMRAADIGNRIRVRTTRRSKNPLVIYDNDPGDWIYILMVGELPRFEMVGWTWGNTGREIGAYKDPYGRGPACWVEQDQLYPFEQPILGGDIVTKFRGQWLPILRGRIKMGDDPLPWMVQAELEAWERGELL